MCYDYIINTLNGVLIWMSDAQMHMQFRFTFKWFPITHGMGIFNGLYQPHMGWYIKRGNTQTLPLLMNTL